MRNKKAFTLIELLVVISIIGILAVLTLIGLRAARVKAEDVHRKSDLRSIGNSLQSYAAENNEKYPISNDDGTGNGYCPEDLSDTSPTGKLLEFTHVPKPNPSSYYQYCHLADDTDFSLFTPSADQVTQLTYSDTGPSTAPTLADGSYDFIQPYWGYQGNNVTFEPNVEVISPNPFNVLVRWPYAIDNSHNVQYQLSYKKTADSAWTTLSKTDQTSHNLATLSNSSSYNFKVTASDPSNHTISTNEVVYNFSSSPSAPTWQPGVQFNTTFDRSIYRISSSLIPVATQDTTNLTLAMEYRLSSSSSWQYTSKPFTIVPVATETGIVDGIFLWAHTRAGTYEYRFKLINKQGSATYYPNNSNPTIFTQLVTGDPSRTDAISPMFACPRNSTGGQHCHISVYPESSQIKFAWEPAFDNVSSIKNYRIMYHDETAHTNTVIVNSPTNQITIPNSQLVSGHQYVFTIMAYDLSNNPALIPPVFVQIP